MSLAKEEAATVATTLEDLRWKHRVLLLFAPDRGSEALQKQRQALEDADEPLAERDLVVFEILARGECRFGGKSLEPSVAADLRGRFGVAPSDEVVILVGKDGGEKRRRAMPDGLGEIHALIDSMPMRRAEMGSR